MIIETLCIKDGWGHDSYLVFHYLPGRKGGGNRRFQHQYRNSEQLRKCKWRAARYRVFLCHFTIFLPSHFSLPSCQNTNGRGRANSSTSNFHHNQISGEDSFSSTDLSSSGTWHHHWPHHKVRDAILHLHLPRSLGMDEKGINEMDFL